MPDQPSLVDAIAHLRAFRSTFNSGDEVDEESHLTAAALDVVIDAAERDRRDDALGSADLAPGGSLGADDLGNLA